MKKNKPFHVIKNLGHSEIFSRKKLLNSLRRAGLRNAKCEEIAQKVTSHIDEGSNTKQIYQHALKLIKKESTLAAAQYSLKKAIFELGPTGYHFETFVAKYFEHKNYRAITSVVMNGRFVKHEVDVIATKGKDQHLVECKFHNKTGIKNDIKTALYVKARWDDLKTGPKGKNIKSFSLASNTSFTLDAITYAQGVKLNLMGLNAPVEYPFIQEIKDLKLYPITSLYKLNKLYKNALLKKGIILVEELASDRSILFNLGMNEFEVEMVMHEAETLLKDSI